MSCQKGYRTWVVWLAVVLLSSLSARTWAETLTLSLSKRPQWVRQQGIVMAGSWEPLLFRVRRDGSPGYTPTPQQRADYLSEHGAETTARLKEMGVNFIMMHCYKGGGLQAEHESMQDAVRFAKHYHDAGMRVGVYNFSGAFIWELFFKEMPGAEQWVLLDDKGAPLTYGSAKYRYRWNRNHPDAQAFYNKLVKFAVEEIKTDLVHFDNYTYGPAHDAVSIQRFRDYLRDQFPAELLGQAGVTKIESVRPPTSEAPVLLRRAWLDFCYRSLAESYHQLNRYARSLRGDVLVECNPAGVGSGIRVPVDHGMVLQGGEAFWDEGRQPGYRNGRLQTKIRTYKVARAMDNMAFCYTISPLAMAESMAFNLDCLGAICWFEYNRIVARPGDPNPVDPTLTPYVQFFNRRRDLLAEAEVVADVAVLRSFASQVLTDRQTQQLTAKVEEVLIENRCPFQIIYDHQLGDLRRYRALILAGCTALPDEQIRQIEQYVAAGGRLCVIGPVATHDRWALPRKRPALANLPPTQVVRVGTAGDWLPAIRQACGGHLSLDLTAEPGLCAELTEKPDKRMVHLVNYHADKSIKQIAIRLLLPKNRQAKTVTLASPGRETDVPLPFQQAESCVRFTVPQVDVYEIAVVRFE